jgi:hypothetical protein
MHRDGEHDAVSPGLQVPAPLQSAPLTIVPAQTVGPHEVLAGANFLQAPAPSHVPSGPQTSVAGGQSSWGSEPTRAGLHVPLCTGGA